MKDGILGNPEFLGFLGCLAVLIVAGVMVFVRWLFWWSYLRRRAQEVRDDAERVRKQVDAAERDIRAGARGALWPVEGRAALAARRKGRLTRDV